MLNGGLVLPLTHLMVYSLVHFCFIVHNHKGLGGCSLTVKNEAKIAALTLHISEVYESGVKSKSKERRGRCMKIVTPYFLDLKEVLDLVISYLLL